MKPNPSILALTLALFLVSCAPLTATPTPAPIVTEEQPIFGMAVVQSVEVQITENSPMQVNTIVRGQLPDAGCTTISSVNQAREGDTFRLTLMTATDPLALCALALTPFEQVVALDIANLPPAEYTVDVNGIETTFELLTRDPGQFKQTLVEALNARNYDLLKILMDESFTIGYWRSEGTSNTPDEAVEQLRLNLLNSSSPITADYSRNLVELLGADPVTIVGPEVVEASPLFVSGLGAEGRDEAILFVAKLPDGGLYWYGLLFAKDGFASNGSIVIEPVVTNPPPVSTDPQPTSVKYILAKQDVSIRSGPGTQYRRIGALYGGQTAKVTGISADGNWWRVICPDDTVGSCWVSAARHLTKPTDGVVSNPPDNTVQNADVQSVEIQILESFPVQVNAIARGHFPDSGCTTISGVTQTRNGNVFTVTIKTKTDLKALCAQMITPFEQAIALDVSSLLPARYIVRVNGVETSFELPDPNQSTGAQFVMAQRDVTMYSGPGDQFSVIGSVASGQIAKVTGVSADGNWWRVICPDDTVGSCWVSAKPADTQPTQSL